MSPSRLRQVYDRVEKLATPLADDLTRSDEFAQIAALVAGVNKAVRHHTDKMAARAWHALNLPAGTDVQRLKVQLGALDREVRLLSLELQQERSKGVNRRGTSGPEQD